MADLILEDGSRSATIEAIANASTAPSRSICTASGPRDELIRKAVMRPSTAHQASFVLAALDEAGRQKAALAAAGIDHRLLRGIPRMPSCWSRSDARTWSGRLPRVCQADELAELGTGP